MNLGRPALLPGLSCIASAAGLRMLKNGSENRLGTKRPGKGRPVYVAKVKFILPMRRLMAQPATAAADDSAAVTGAGDATVSGAPPAISHCWGVTGPRVDPSAAVACGGRERAARASRGLQPSGCERAVGSTILQ